jgi:hypothetical protein
VKRARRRGIGLGAFVVMAVSAVYLSACQRSAKSHSSSSATRPEAFEIEAVKQRLGAMVGEDQDARSTGKPISGIDRRNTAEMRTLLKKYGWIRISVFGSDADHQAWLLVQHADQDRAFQQSVLETLRPLALEGETAKHHYPYLYDRVALSSGSTDSSGILTLTADKRQRYGTQGACVGGRWEPFALEDPVHVDALRREMGLGPLDEYRKLFVCR